MNSSNSNYISINNRKIGDDFPVYFIAEIGSNFDGNLNRAKELIYLAKENGAEAAKFQHYTADSLVSDVGFQQISGINTHQSDWSQSVFKTYEKASLNKEWTAELKNTCDEVGIEFMTSPYSLELIEYVEKYINSYKIGSGEITWIKSIEKMAKTMKPLLLATGASSETEVKLAVDSILKYHKQLVLMQCNTSYTASPDNYKYLNLNVLKSFKRMYPKLVLGLSDHMPGDISVLGAVSLGAKVIEKHFTDSNNRVGPDHSFAMNPIDWKNMVSRTRELEDALGGTEKRIEKNEKETVVVQRRCIRVKENLHSGHVFKSDDFIMLRPCPEDGIAPYQLNKIIGKKLLRELKQGEHVTNSHLID
tara:strand:- start:393 stop:1478 length:1086 start_codon:yes stop_codon:yes gene_type:complete